MQVQKQEKGKIFSAIAVTIVFGDKVVNNVHLYSLSHDILVSVKYRDKSKRIGELRE